MNTAFNLIEARSILARTPGTLSVLLHSVGDSWANVNEGPDTWSPYDVIGHLIHGERTDWIARLRIILSDGENKAFTPFDRFAQFHESAGKSLEELLAEFAALRKTNLEILDACNIAQEQLDRTGVHPKFGLVTLRNLLATWVAHDLNHIAQIARVMGKRYREDVGPWTQYLRIMNM